MSLIEKISPHQRKVAIILSLITALAIEEHYIGYGKELVSRVKESYENFCNNYLNPNNYFNQP